MTSRASHDDRWGAWQARPVEAWAAFLDVPRLELHTRLSSTNDRLRALLGEGAPPFTVVVAGAQTRGRGRNGRTWYSPQDMGLWMSLLVPWDPSILVRGMSLAAGVAVARAVEAVFPVSIGLKWPNDLLIGERKVGGILCEARHGRGVIVGVGVNLRKPPVERMPQALGFDLTFLEAHSGAEVPDPELARCVVREMRRWVTAVSGTLSSELRAEWAERDWLRGRRVRVADETVGTAVGVGIDGALSVKRDDGQVVRVRTGSVRIERAEDAPGPHSEV